MHTLANANPAHTSRWLATCLVALVLALLAWSLAAQLDIVVSAPGRLVPASQVKPVQAADAGVVREVLVHDGARVDAGQLMVRLDATAAGADLSAVTQELALRRLTLSAIDAALLDRALTRTATDDAAQFAQVHAQFLARRTTLADALAHERQGLQRAENDRLAALQVRDKLHATLPLVRNAREAYVNLQREGFVGELMANDKLRELVEREQDLKAQEAAVLAQDALIEQTRQRMVQLRSTFRSQLLTERVDALAAIQRLEQELAKLGYRNTLAELRAPQDGVVQELAPIAAGTVVAAGATLFNIVPEDDVLTAEVALDNADAGFIVAGQSVKLKVATFPFQKYGLLDGHVLRLGADVADPQSTARALGTAALRAPPLAYRATVELVDRTLRVPGGGELRLAPGMAVVAEIHQGRRTVMEYLLSPMLKVANDAARER